jgi:ATP-binding cassette, subfamily C, bacterial LapB
VTTSAKFESNRDGSIHPASEVIENQVHANLARLAAEFGGQASESPSTAEDALISTINGIVRPETPAEACLAPALALLGWAGEGRLIREALPHFDRIENSEALRRVLALLGYGTNRRFAGLSGIEPHDMPCLFTRNGTDVALIVERDSDGTLLAFEGKSAAWKKIEPAGQFGWVLSIWDQSVDSDGLEQGASWLWAAIKQFKPTIVATFGLSLLGNVAALALPIFVIAVYDLGIGTKSTNTIVMFSIGAGIVITTNLALRSIRARAMAYFGARIDALIGMKAFEVILNMPVSLVEAAPIDTQISRLRQFESMRDFFTGTLASSVVDVPFIFIFLIAIALWGGNLVWVPISLIGIYIGLSAITVPITRKFSRAIGFAKQRRNILLREIFTKRRAIRALSAEDVWIARHQDLVDLIADQSHRAHRFNSTVQNLGELLVSIGGVATLGLGALSVTRGSMTSGALIGTMALVWRVMSPLQSTYLSLPRIAQAVQTFGQIDRLMKIRSERGTRAPQSFFRQFRGKLSVQRLAFRYPQKSDAVLRGVQLEIRPGETIAVTGASGAGKTTLLKLMAGLYPPTMGAVLADDMDLRQIDPTEWRSQIAFLPETANFFYGTLAQNIRMARPDASDDDVLRALKEMGLDGEEHLMREGIDGRLTAADFDNFPDALKQRLALARCFVKNAPLYLLDNPAASLDTASELNLLRKLGELKGRATIVFTTFRPSHMRLADRLIVLKDGQVAEDGPPDRVLEHISTAA